jgi:CubicO group peptidase (beta-lactamase class C family)
MIKSIYCLIGLLICIGCSIEKTESDTRPVATNYFPPLTGAQWETTSIVSLNWNQSAVAPLLNYLELKNSKSFLILINGRIVMENYFNGHSAAANWYWASAGKTLTAAMIGIAEQEAHLDINSKVSHYLGT